MSGEICLLNDSFPPIVDGVSNVVLNYAVHLQRLGRPVSVVTPKNPDSNDSVYSFPVLRYPSIDLRKQIGYTAGSILSPGFQREMMKRNIALYHLHCPATSAFIARELRGSKPAPLVMTYHTKYDVELATMVKPELLRQSVIRGMIANISACDELWTVSDGAGRNVQKLGYEGDYIIMPNGVDFPRTRSTPEEIQQATCGFNLPADVPLFLFVGRMRWYKGLRIILDALAALRSQEMDFRAVFIGSGSDEEEIRQYAAQLHLSGHCLFTGMITDRQRLLAWYSRADLFLFPSTFDTNGLVIREAAACSLGAVMVKGSCAAEGVTHLVDGVLIEENAASLAVALCRLMEHPEKMKQLGENASRNLYLSWEDAVHRAMERYEIVIDLYHSGKYAKKKTFTDGLMELYGGLVDWISDINENNRF